MSDFDLIPEDYRYWQWQRRCMVRTGFLLLAVLLCVLAASAWLRFHAAQQDSVVIDLQRRMAMADIQQNQLASLRESKQRLESHWTLLEGLRSGARVESTLLTIDESLSGNEVWFLNWTFKRIAEKVAADRPATSESYLVSFTDHLAGGRSEILKVDTQLSITGQASSHSAFSAFVQKLSSAVDVLDVRVSRTSLVSINDKDVVEFNIQVVIDNAAVADSG